MKNNVSDEEVRRAMEITRLFKNKFGVTLQPSEALSYVRGERTPENMDLETTMNESNTGRENIPTKIPASLDPSNPLNNPGFQEYMKNNPRTAADEAYTELAMKGMNIDQLRKMSDEELEEELRKIRQRQSTMDAQGPGLFNFELNAGF